MLLGSNLKYLHVECSSYLTVCSINLSPYLLICGNESDVAWGLSWILNSVPKLFKCVGVFIYLLTENNEFYKIDTRDRSIKKSEAEFEENFSGAGIDFTLSLREKSLYSQG